MKTFRSIILLTIAVLFHSMVLGAQERSGGAATPVQSDPGSKVTAKRVPSVVPAVDADTNSMVLQEVPPAPDDAIDIPEMGTKKLSQDETAELDELQRGLDRLNAEYKMLAAQIKNSKGMIQRLFEGRKDNNRSQMMDLAIEFIQMVATRHTEKKDVRDYWEKAAIAANRLPDTVDKSVARVNKENRKVSDEELAPGAQASLDARLSKDSERVDEMLGKLIRNIKSLDTFGIDVLEEENRLRYRLKRSAEMRSVFLELTIEDVALIAAQLKQLPEDADIRAKHRVMKNRADIIVEALQRSVVLMEEMGMDTSRLDAQLLEATGAISLNIFDPELLKNFLSKCSESISLWFDENGLSMIFRTTMFLLIIFVFWSLSRVVAKLVRNVLERTNNQLSQLLRRMIISLSKNIVLLVGLLIAAAQLGVSVGPVLAGLGVAGFILGFALQDTLSNFASGMMILLYRPFDVGDLLDAGGVFGRVNEMSLVNTTILTLDNQTLIVPNNKIWGDIIKNVTAQDVRRVDMMFGISYSDDIPKTEETLKEILDSCDLVLKDPEYMVHLHELGDSSVNFVVRPWAKTDDYWDVYWDITRKVKMVFDEKNISIPFPQRDVHFYDTRKEDK